MNHGGNSPHGAGLAARDLATRPLAGQIAASSTSFHQDQNRTDHRRPLRAHRSRHRADAVSRPLRCAPFTGATPTTNDLFHHLHQRSIAFLFTSPEAGTRQTWQAVPAGTLNHHRPGEATCHRHPLRAHRSRHRADAVSRPLLCAPFASRPIPAKKIVASLPPTVYCLPIA